MDIFNQSVNNNCTVFSKSSMCNLDGDYKGRPFGGLTTLCKNHPDLIFQQMEVSCDRLQVIKVCDKEGVCMQYVINAYMPYYDPKGSQTVEYISVIDHLQSLIDNTLGSVPLKIIGDMNVQLPRGNNLIGNWHKRKGFNKHSKLFYDFLAANNLICADLCSTQKEKFTFFCHKRAVYTWIDHVATTTYDMKNVQDCSILPLCYHNVSDHLPLKCTFLVNTVVSKTSSYTYQAGPRPNWGNTQRNVNYADLLNNKLSEINVHYNDSFTKPDIESYINNVFEYVCNSMHSCAKESGIVPSKCFRPKPYWCPNLSVLRDRKRFWWHLWVSAGRPRTGIVYDCWKGVKKLFRRECRNNIRSCLNRRVFQINSMFRNKNMVGFWRKLNLKRSAPSNSSISADTLAEYYHNVMHDDHVNLTAEQQDIQNATSLFFNNHCDTVHVQNVDMLTIKSVVSKLKHNSSPGLDGVSAEHILHAGVNGSDQLCHVLARLYTLILSHNIVPTLFRESYIVPVLKKSTLDPNVCSNFRPITVSSSFAKMVEMLMVPEQDGIISNAQFGFRQGRDTTAACSFLNDILCYFKDQGTPVYVCSLDAQRCFDSIWHAGLFYKLRDVLPLNHWLLLYRWYHCSYAKVRWQGTYSHSFHVTRGTKQGSILSPILFNFFLNDLLLELKGAQPGVCIESECFNNFAYADDISVFATTVPGVQTLMDVCHNYAIRWRFNFGVAKSKCMIAGHNIPAQKPSFKLGDNEISVVNNLDILGVTFNSDVTYNDHVAIRSSKCQKCMFRIQELGMTYPGLSTEVKSHLWNTMGLPTLMYGCSSLNMSKCNLKDLNSCQSNNIKRCLGLGRRVHHSELLEAAGVKPVEDIYYNGAISLYYRLYKVDSPTSVLNTTLLSKYICEDSVVEGTLIAKLVSQGVSPVSAMIKKPKIPSHCVSNSGIVESLRFLLHTENFVKPWSIDHILVSLLTKAF